MGRAKVGLKGGVLAGLGSLLAGLGAVLLFFLCAAQILVTAHMPVDESDRIVFRWNGPLQWLALLALTALLVVLHPLLERLRARTVFLILSLLYLFCALYLVYRVPVMIWGDPYMILKHATNFIEGNYIGLTDGYYLNFYPYQLGMLAYETALLRLGLDGRAFFLMNVLFVLLTDLLQWRIAALFLRRRYGGETLAEKYAIVFTFAFLPMLPVVLYVYGTIPGLFCFEAAVFLLLRFLGRPAGDDGLRKGVPPRAVWLLPALEAAGSVACMTAACLFKPNYLVGLIAVCLVLGVLALREKRARFLVLAVVFFLAEQLGSAMLYRHYRAVSGIGFGDGVPLVLVLAEGLMPEDEDAVRIGGWYNGYEYDTFEELGYDEELARQVGREKLGELAVYWGARPAEAVVFLVRKVVSTWCDPVFGSVTLGPMVELGAAIRDPILESFYSGDYAFLFLETMLGALNVLLYGFAARHYLGLVKRPLLARGRERWAVAAELLVLLFFLGGFFYHVIGETKDLYVLPFAYCLLPIAGWSFSEVRWPFRTGASRQEDGG